MKTSISAVVALLAFSAVANATPIWGLESRVFNVAGGSTSPTHLFWFESDGSSFTDVGLVRLGSSTGPALDVDALSITAGGTLYGYGLSGVGSTLLTIDPVTAVATSIGQELTGRDMRGAAYSNGVIYALDSQNNALLQVNPATGVPTSVLQLTMAGSPYLLTNATDLAFDPTGAVYVVEGDRDGIVDQTFLGTRFFSLDTATGVLTLVGTDTAGGLRVGMGAAFADGFLFVNEMNDGDDIYQYSGAGFGTRATVFLNPIADNSGRGDLANVVADVVIPEPATFGLIGTALLALAALRRRRA